MSVQRFTIFAIILLISTPARNAPVESKQNTVKILEMTRDMNDDGSFKYVTSLDDGTFHSVEGKLKQVNGTTIIIHEGKYSYALPEGGLFTVIYVADENGFQIKFIQKGYAPTLQVNSKAIASILG